MSLEDKHISGSILRKIRADLSLKQKDLKCEGLQNVSRLENGEAQMSYLVAKRLCKKINEIIKEKCVILDYEVTEDLLMGWTSILIDDALYKLKTRENEDTIFEEINQIIFNLNSDEAIEFIIKTLEILNTDIYKYNEEICNYCYKLLNYNLTDYIRIEVLNYLIRAHFIQNQYRAVVSIGKSFSNEVHKNATNEQKEKFFGNIANAHYHLKQYKDCEVCLKSIISFNNKETELFFLSLQATCKGKLGNKDDAIKIYENIINKSGEINNIEYMANSYSDIGDLYLKSDIELAKKYINKSIELTSRCKNKKFILNCYYNKLLLSIEENNIESIKYSFNFSMSLAKDLNDDIVQNKLVLQILNYCIENKMDDDLVKFIVYLKNRYDYFIQDSTIVSCINHINDKNLLYKVIKIAQKV